MIYITEHNTAEYTTADLFDDEVNRISTPVNLSKYNYSVATNIVWYTIHRWETLHNLVFKSYWLWLTIKNRSIWEKEQTLCHSVSSKKSFKAYKTIYRRGIESRITSLKYFLVPPPSKMMGLSYFRPFLEIVHTSPLPFSAVAWLVKILMRTWPLNLLVNLT